MPPMTVRGSVTSIHMNMMTRIVPKGSAACVLGSGLGLGLLGLGWG